MQCIETFPASNRCIAAAFHYYATDGQWTRCRCDVQDAESGLCRAHLVQRGEPMNADLIRELRATIRIHEGPFDRGGCEGECVNCDLLRRCLAALLQSSPLNPQEFDGKSVWDPARQK